MGRSSKPRGNNTSCQMLTRSRWFSHPELRLVVQQDNMEANSLCDSIEYGAQDTMRGLANA